MNLFICITTSFQPLLGFHQPTVFCDEETAHLQTQRVNDSGKDVCAREAHSSYKFPLLLFEVPCFRMSKPPPIPRSHAPSLAKDVVHVLIVVTKLPLFRCVCARGICICQLFFSSTLSLSPLFPLHLPCMTAGVRTTHQGFTKEKKKEKKKYLP